MINALFYIEERMLLEGLSRDFVDRVIHNAQKDDEIYNLAVEWLQTEKEEKSMLVAELGSIVYSLD